jgi:hypothetical protein
MKMSAAPSLARRFAADFTAHNVPAVYDVFAARIRALRSKDQGCKNVTEFWRGNGAKRNDLAKT